VLKHWAIFIGYNRIFLLQKDGGALPSRRYAGLNDFHPYRMKAGGGIATICRIGKSCRRKICALRFGQWSDVATIGVMG